MTLWIEERWTENVLLNLTGLRTLKPQNFVYVSQVNKAGTLKYSSVNNENEVVTL